MFCGAEGVEVGRARVNCGSVARGLEYGWRGAEVEREEGAGGRREMDAERSSHKRAGAGRDTRRRHVGIWKGGWD